MLFEELGIPTVTVGTSAFTDLLQLEAEQRGLGGLERVIVPHPIGGLKPEAVRSKVDDSVVAALLSALTDGGGETSGETNGS